MFNLYQNDMFTVNKRRSKFTEYFENNQKLTKYLSDNILKYIDINRIKNLQETEFIIQNQSSYLILLKHYDDPALFKIFKISSKFNYIILSNNPKNWNNFFKKKEFKGIFMNTNKIDNKKCKFLWYNIMVICMIFLISGNIVECIEHDNCIKSENRSLWTIVIINMVYTWFNMMLFYIIYIFNSNSSIDKLLINIYISNSSIDELLINSNDVLYI